MYMILVSLEDLNLIVMRNALEAPIIGDIRLCNNIVAFFVEQWQGNGKKHSLLFWDMMVEDKV